MEQILSSFAAFYPLSLITLTVLAVVIYTLDIKNQTSRILNFMFFGTVISYFIGFAGNYGFEPFMIAWGIRDLLILHFALKIGELFFIEKRFFMGTLSVLTIGMGLLFYQKDNLNLNLNIFQANSFEFDNSAELLFDIKNIEDLPKVKNLLKEYNAEIIQAFPQIASTSITELDNCYTIDIDDLSFLKEIIEKLKNSGLINWIEDNEVYKLPAIEVSTNQNDKQPPSILNDPYAAKIWGFNHIDMAGFLKILKKKKPVKKAKIFILDTGVDATHEDLKDNYISLNSKYDQDTNKHGTHCAGIACAVTNNQIGIPSLNLTGKFTSVTSITVIPGGRGTQESIIDGMILAADNGADVISMSLGGRTTPERQKAYNAAIKYANDKGAIVVVAAGNSNQNAKSHIPASCEGVITVSAIDENFNKADFSNDVSDMKYGIAAPGVNIYSTTPNGQYESFNGTSMATPFVAAVLGIMKSLQPDLSTEEAYQILSSTGVETKSTKITGKCVQPLNAITNIKSKGAKVSAIKFIDKLMTFDTQK